MSRLIAFAIVVLPAVAGAYSPVFSRSGLYLNLQYGPGSFKFTESRLAPQLAQQGADTASAAVFVNETGGRPWDHTASARLGLNLAGHLSAEAVLTATGWDVTTDQRGGGGFLGGALAWHPLQLFFQDNRSVDLSAFAGGGYGIVGKSVGADGYFWTWGGAFDYYFSPSFYLGAFYRRVLPQFDKFYLNYDQRSVPGNTLALPEKSGGVFWNAGLTMGFRMEL